MNARSDPMSRDESVVNEQWVPMSESANIRRGSEFGTPILKFSQKSFSGMWLGE